MTIRKIDYYAKFYRNDCSLKITEQSHRGGDFTDNGHKFKAKNGITLTSDLRPEITKYCVFVRGFDSDSDNTIMKVESHEKLQKICDAIDEYNKTFSKDNIVSVNSNPCLSKETKVCVVDESGEINFERVDEVHKKMFGEKSIPSNKLLEVEARWDDEFNVGLLRIKNQKIKSFNDRKIVLFKFKDITISSSSFPDWSEEYKILYCQGTMSNRDNKTLVIRNKESFYEVLNAIEEYNKSVLKIDYVKLHEELWIGISQGKDKKEYCKELCEKYYIEIPVSFCFLCEKAINIDRVNRCSRCDGKWFSDKKGKCFDEGSYYILRHHETDQDLKKALAIKISKCAY